MNLKNISFPDIILIYSYWNCLYRFSQLRGFLKIRRLFRNYLSVSINTLRKKYPFLGILKNGDSVILSNESEVLFYIDHYKGFEYDVTNDIVTIPPFAINHKRPITIHGGITNGEIMNVFVNNAYQYLPVKNRIVIDIGANIADSAIYFALRGATKIICIEPFPRNYELAEKNIRLNDLSDKISLILAGCSDNKGEINIDPSYKSTNASIIKDFKVGIKVRLVTLEDIIKENNLPSDGSLIMKMDCEGFEYRSILSASERTLQSFSHMMIEYHHGYKNLKEKLEKSGFKVTITRPRMFTWRQHTYIMGYIFAKRNS